MAVLDGRLLQNHFGHTLTDFGHHFPFFVFPAPKPQPIGLIRPIGPIGPMFCPCGLSASGAARITGRATARFWTPPMYSVFITFLAFLAFLAFHFMPLSPGTRRSRRLTPTTPRPAHPAGQGWTGSAPGCNRTTGLPTSGICRHDGLCPTHTMRLSVRRG